MKRTRAVLPLSGQPARTVQPISGTQVYARDDFSGAGRHDQAKLLLVEDDYLVASQMETALTDAGFAVAEVVASAEEAISAATHQVDLVVMDVRLAGCRDGVDAAVELFDRHGIRSIFATAHCDAEIRRRAAPAKPLGWLQKPYSMSSLVAVVRGALDRLDEPE